MKRSLNLPFWLTLFGIGLIGSVAMSYVLLIETSPLEFGEMDFDQNGFVTFWELIYSNLNGTRQIIENDRTCIEYYASIDGSRLKTVCHETRR